MKLRISSRQSPLAKIQSYQVGAALQTATGAIEIDYLFRQSLGDQNLNDPLWKMPEKGVFTEDFYQDLVQGSTDMVVHSWKDLPTEEKKDTFIAATLERADQRDLLLFKKSSFKKTDLQIYSSSPRRALNLKEFFSWALPWKTESLQFQSVRGNISTRVQKLLESAEIDGLIVAKAAMDRLLSDTLFPETAQSLRQNLEKLQWMVLPLGENPNAAAQGALAIEVARKNEAALSKLAQIHHQSTFRCAQRERDILKEFGGGCHLALGMSVLERDFGRIEIVRGLTPAGEKIQSKTFLPTKKHPAHWKVGRLEFESERKTLDFSLPADADAIFVSRADAAQVSVSSKIVWTAGLQTWKKLAASGVWVHGSAESLGEKEEARIDILAGRSLQWVHLTHDAALAGDDAKRIATYHLNLRLKTATLGDSEIWSWKSGSELKLALEKFPELRNRAHLCGPGRSFEAIRQLLGSDEKIYVELNDEFITAL